MPIQYEIVEEKGRKFAEITGYEGSISTLVIAKELGGYPVERIRGHAFEGRTDLREVYLPESLRCLKTFVFHKCSSLTRISMFDGIRDYHDGVIRHCASLEEVEITFAGNTYELVRDLLADNDRALHFVLHRPEGDVNVMFPDYVVVASENTMARTIQFAFEGVGYAYRECVRKKEIRWREYDSLFETMTHFGTEISLRIALDRLMYPLDLDPGSKERYGAFVSDHAREALLLCIERGYRDYIDFLVGEKMLSEEAADQGLRAASDRGETEICAILMEYLRECGNNGGDRQGDDLTLDLEEW